MPIRRVGRSGCLLVMCVLLHGVALPQDTERVRLYCDPRNPDTNCPGEKCICLDHTLEVTFYDVGHVLSVDPWDLGSTFWVSVVSETAWPGIQGWSYGVRHDPRFLDVEAVGMGGTDAAAAFDRGFEMTTADGVEECEAVSGTRCFSPGPSGGWIQAVILSLSQTAELPPGRNSLATAAYKLTGLPPQSGTLVEITGRLRRFVSPPIEITLNSSGGSGEPTWIVDGRILGWYGPAELCSNDWDDDSDGLTDCSDPDCLGARGCPGLPEICGNGKDDDGDRVQDCWDADCAESNPPCTEVCGNLVDDDADGYPDCYDQDCRGQPACVWRLEDCSNNWDDDFDGTADCDDMDCSLDTACYRGGGFLRGDADGNLRINVIDAVLSVPLGDPPGRIDCNDAMDADDDGRLTILDPIAILSYIFAGRSELPSPHGRCGVDVTVDRLVCNVSSCSQAFEAAPR
jgi:hypothetical protein